VLLQGDHVWLFAPKRKANEAAIIFKSLVAAYDQLFAIVGVHTKYKIVVYHLPMGWGGTSECVIEYDYSNLDLEKFDEWRRYKVPHVSGYVEEMAHNFVHAEMQGSTSGTSTATSVAPRRSSVRAASITAAATSGALWLPM